MTTATDTPKERLHQLIEEQPDDSSYEDLLRELVFAGTVERGLADSRAGDRSATRR